jgi:predicted amidohydrolase
MQFAPTLGDSEATMARIEHLAAKAAEADLLVLPELCNSGYNLASRDQAWQTSEQIGGPFTQFLESLCRRHSFYAVSGLNERDGNRLYNASILVGPDGYRGRYRKLHLFMNEVDFFQPGDEGLPVFDLDFCRVGMLVCFDWLYPEAWRVLALAGADVICHPSNLVLPGLAQRAVPIRALTNRVYVVTANRVGTEGNLTFTGLSTIAGPRGDLLAQAPAEGEAVAVVEADVALARDKQITPRNHLLAGRRPEAYGLLCRDNA